MRHKENNLKKQGTVTVAGEEIYTASLKFQKARKTALANVCRMDKQFEVETLEGTMTGQPGDYLARGVKGELYPIAAAVFDSSYEIVND